MQYETRRVGPSSTSNPNRRLKGGFASLVGPRHFDDFAHKWQFFSGDPRADDFSESKLQRRQRRHIAVRTKVGIVCTIDKRKQNVESLLFGDGRDNPE